EVLETGGGLKKASWFFNDGPFVVMNADILTDLNLNGMIAFHQEYHPMATLAVTSRSTSRYFLFNESGRLCGWRNTKTHEERLVANNTNATQDITGAAGHARPTLKEKAFSGIHVISPEIFPLIHQEGKFSMVDVYLELAGSHPIFEYDHSGTKLIDVGKPESVPIAESLFP
ncbi:MAG TPA: hypothetical protein VG890_03310, partial [Puia sp.]|nr:hypothetical protein [Puia sp.]